MLIFFLHEMLEMTHDLSIVQYPGIWLKNIQKVSFVTKMFFTFIKSGTFYLWIDISTTVKID